jgi:hypothetical protein
VLLVHRTFPAFQRLPRPAVCSSRPRRPPSAARTPRRRSPPAPVSFPNHRLLPGSLSLCPVGLGKKTPTRYRFGQKFWQSGPLCQPISFFFFFLLTPAPDRSWAGKACAIWAGQAPYSRPVSNSVYVVFFLETQLTFVNYCKKKI